LEDSIFTLVNSCFQKEKRECNLSYSIYLMEDDITAKCITFAERVSLLLTAINLSGSNIKDIAAATGINGKLLRSIYRRKRQINYCCISWSMSQTDWNWQNWYYHKNPGSPDASIWM